MSGPTASQPVVPALLNRVAARHAEETKTESLFDSTKTLLTLLSNMEEHRAAAEWGDPTAADQFEHEAARAEARLEELRQESASYEVSAPPCTPARTTADRRPG